MEKDKKGTLFITLLKLVNVVFPKKKYLFYVIFYVFSNIIIPKLDLKIIDVL